MSYFWLSFCDPQKPKGTQFLGVCIVEAISFLQAVEISHILGCNPGGEVKGTEIANHLKISLKWTNRLLSYEECKQVDDIFTKQNHLHEVAKI